MEMFFKDKQTKEKQRDSHQRSKPDIAAISFIAELILKGT